MKDENSLISYNSDDERTVYLAILKEVTNELYRKAKKGRFHDVQKDKLRLDYWKGVIYSVNSMSKIYKEKQLDELEKDLNELKKGLIIEVPSKSDEGLETENLRKLEELDEKIDRLKE